MIGMTCEKQKIFTVQCGKYLVRPYTCLNAPLAKYALLKMFSLFKLRQLEELRVNLTKCKNKTPIKMNDELWVKCAVIIYLKH